MPDWKPGDYASIEIGGALRLACVLATSDISRREHNYDLVQLRLYRKRRDGNNQVEIVHEDDPEPVQSYRLHRTGARPASLPDPPARPNLADYWQCTGQARKAIAENAQPEQQRGRGCMIAVGDQTYLDGRRIK